LKLLANYIYFFSGRSAPAPDVALGITDSTVRNLAVVPDLVPLRLKLVANYIYFFSGRSAPAPGVALGNTDSTVRNRTVAPSLVAPQFLTGGHCQ